MEIEELQNSLKEKENQVASLEEELQQLKEMEVVKNADIAPDHTAEVEELQKRLEEKEGQVTSMEAELKLLREQTVRAQSESNEGAGHQVSIPQPDVREVLQSLFPHITVETEQANWLQEFTQKAQESLSQNQRSEETQQSAVETTESAELLAKLKEAEESHSTLQAECDQYRNVLAETEGMLKDLQKSVEDEELVWRAKIAHSEEQLQRAMEQVLALETAAEKMRLENRSTEQLRGQVMLLEAQLEKQLDTTTPSDSPNYPEDKTEVQSQPEQSTEKMEDEEPPSEGQEQEPEQRQEQEPEQEVSEESEQTQQAAPELQEPLDDAPAPDTAATIAEQEELTKEEDQTPLDRLQGKGESEELTEGTSV